MNFDNFKYNKSNVPADNAKKKLFFQELKTQFLDELNEKTDHQEYFKKYDPDSVKSFLTDYADRKADLAESYEYYTDLRTQDKQFKFREYTERTMDAILQKKLFNMQLLWRAEKIHIKEIQIAFDFEFWETHVRACPFLPPVTKEEIRAMQQCLSNSQICAIDFSRGVIWQQYEHLTDLDDNGNYSYMPYWYEVYDKIFDTGSLLLLPDTRGDKEEYYREVAKETWLEKDRKRIAKRPPEPEPKPPRLSGNWTTFLEYAQHFETDPHFIELFTLYNDGFRKYEETPDDKYYIYDDAMRDAFELLLEADIPLTMPGGMPWRVALCRCSNSYVNSVVSAELDSLYEEYLMYKDIKISPANDFNDVWQKYLNDEVCKIVRDQILLGRKLCGEPEDFNF